MLLPYDKASYRSVNCGIFTTAYVHSDLKFSSDWLDLSQTWITEGKNLLFDILLAFLFIFG